MTVINAKRIAHCPLCNQSINRRSITENEKIGKLVLKVQNLIESIGRDTGFDGEYLVFNLMISVSRIYGAYAWMIKECEAYCRMLIGRRDPNAWNHVT